MDRHFPQGDWERITPEEAGFSAAKLSAVESRLAQASSERMSRTVVARAGRLVAEWNLGVSREAKLNLRSASKSLIANLLGSAVEQGRLASTDAPLRHHYPQALEVPPGYGPKPEQYVRPKDHDITLRQLASHTSGYLKPNESPGEVFHYQTYAYVALSHALAATYALHDSEGFPNLATLFDRLRGPLRSSWVYYPDGFEFPRPALNQVFARLLYVRATALDMARLGLLWLASGSWRGEQLIPAWWLRESTRTATEIIANCPEEDWRYGYGFWTNDHGKMWPNLPRDSFAAWGAGSQHIWVCPSLDLVIVQSPGAWEDQRENDAGPISWILQALR